MPKSWPSAKPAARSAAFSFRSAKSTLRASPAPCAWAPSYWARPARVFYAATHQDAAAAGFDDHFIYSQIDTPPASRAIPMIRLETRQAALPFEEWSAMTDKSPY